MRDVHDDVAQPEEGLGVERLREEVGQVVVRGDEGHAQLVLLDALALHSRLSPGQTLGHWCQSTPGHPRHVRH